jgi:N-acetylmuramoyl-L-alanine amidase
MAKILLDAGHYGKYNQSPQVKEYYEAERMWVLCRLLQMQLEKRGHLVHTTRDDQKKDLAVVERGKKAQGYDIFISLHSNDFDGSEEVAKANKIDYVVAYAPSYAKNDRCKNSQALGLRFAKYFSGIIKAKQEPRVDTLLKSNGDEYYGVLRGWQKTNCEIGFIIEHGFHSNPKTAKWLLDDENLLNLASGEANIIDAYLKGDFEEKEESKVETPKEIKVGSIVKIRNGAYMYGTTRKLSSWVYPLEWVVLQVKGRKVIVDKSADGKHSIETPVLIDDLTLIK